VTRGQLPQRAGLPGLNGSGAAAAVLREKSEFVEPSDTSRKHSAAIDDDLLSKQREIK